MENATKALLIAGSVLIAIVLIAVGIRILGSAEGVTNSVEGVSQTMEISIFNSQFTKYEGRQKHTAVKQLINTIILNNERENANYIVIDLSDNNRGGGSRYESWKSSDLTSLRDWVSNYCSSAYYDYFDVSFNIDSNGRVNEVDIAGEDVY